MTCPRCQTVNRDDAHFCEECGARIDSICPECGGPISLGTKFCRSCGVALVRTAWPTSSGAPAGSLTERLVRSPLALTGERKQVTVLFADVKSSLELLAGRDPEEARALLDALLTRMMEAVHFAEGTVNQLLGDGLMAIFGAPVAHEDHAVRACYAALRMQGAIARYAPEVAQTFGIDVKIRIGLNSGEVVVRSIASDVHVDYTAIGQTTHLAARMEQLAAPGTILATADTFHLAERYIAATPRGPIQIKGLPAALEVYEIVGVSPVSSRWHGAVAQGLTPFVGRASELQQLRAELARAREGRGRLVAVVGDPGVGKSRVCWEFVHGDAVDGCRVVWSTANSFGKAAPYRPIVDLLKTYFEIDDHDDPSAVSDTVAARVRALGPELRETLNPLLSLLDGRVVDETWNTLDPAQRRRSVLDAVTLILLHASLVQPLVVIVEDLHWIDSETQAVLDHLVHRLPSARLLLVVVYRPEYRHPWASKTYYHQIAIDPLPASSVEQLLEALLGDDPGLESLKQSLIDRTEGNTFFLEESVRILVETGILGGRRGSRRLDHAVQTASIPPTVQAVLAARIDRLLPEDKELLQQAAAIGRDVPLELLRAVAGVDDDTLRSRLARLQAAEFMYQTRLSPEQEYAFRHALTHEVAYTELTEGHRTQIHRLVMQELERVGGEPTSARTERLAHHALRARIWDKAMGYLSQAGALAAGRSAHREAVSFLEQAIAAAAHLPTTREHLERVIELRFAARNSLWPLWDNARMFEHLQRARELAETLGDPRRIGRVLSFMTQHHRIVGEAEQSIAAGRQALALAEQLGDAELATDTNFRLGMTFLSLGDYRQASALITRSLDGPDGHAGRQRSGRPGVPSVVSRVWLSLCLGQLGEFDAGLDHAREAIRISEELDHPFSLISGCFGLGDVLLHRGDVDGAIAVLERGRALAVQYETTVLFRLIASLLGYAHALTGRTDDGIGMLRQSIQDDGAGGGTAMAREALYLVWLAETELLAGRSADAEATGERGISLARTRKERGHEAWALRVLAECAARQGGGREDVAEERFAACLGIAEELQMRPLVAIARFGRARLFEARGRTREAKEDLALAMEFFTRAAMPRWLALATEPRPHRV